MQDNVIDSVRNVNIENNLYMASDSVTNMQELRELSESEAAVETGEQLIKDSKTSSGVSISQASTNLQTHMGSQISSGAVAASGSPNTQQQNIQGVQAAGAVPPSNQPPAHSVLNEENHSEMAYQSVDGASIARRDDAGAFETASNHSFKSKKGKNKEKKE